MPASENLHSNGHWNVNVGVRCFFDTEIHQAKDRVD
jgi:hypothetical protein